MLPTFALATLLVTGIAQQKPVQAHPHFDGFDVATIRLTPADTRGRYITMQGTHRFVGINYTLKRLIAAAYELNPRTISSGPDWAETDRYDILAITPGEDRPSHDEQMAMLRKLLADRFKLTFHREPKEFSIYALSTAKDGPKLKQSSSAPDEPSALLMTVFPDHIHLPAHNATMDELSTMLQRAVLDRPVVNHTGITGHFDFDLDWAPDDSQFGGEMPPPPANTSAPPLFVAMQEQLGLHLEATRGMVDTLVIDSAQRPSEN